MKGIYLLGIALVLCSAWMTSCGPAPGSASLRGLGARPLNWGGGDLKGQGGKKVSVWLSPDNGRLVQQMKITRDAGDGPESYLSMTRAGHAIDSIKRTRVNGADVIDIRCRPLPQTSTVAKFSRQLYFIEASTVDSILFSGTSKAEMSSPEFRQMYSRLGIDSY
jgi:hypothetical protein